jgi:hypothetical protein
MWGEGGRVSVVDKGKGIDSFDMDECVVDGVVRSDALVNVTQPCVDVEVFSEEGHIWLRSCPTFTRKKSAGTAINLCFVDNKGNSSFCGVVVQGF